MLVVFPVALIVEQIFYFTSQTRWMVWTIAFILAGAGLVGLLVIGISIALNRLPRHRWSTLARRIGKMAFPREDTVINALQLERSYAHSSSSRDLSHAYIDSVWNTLAGLDRRKLIPHASLRRWKIRTAVLLILNLVFISATWSDSTAALYRWAHPRTAFPAPKPFALRSLSGDLHILGGEPTLISIQAYPEEPDSVYIKLTRKQSSFIPDDSTAREAERIITTARDSTDLFRFPLQDIYRDYTYQAFVKAQHFWEPWREIHSPEHEIVVTDRPGMEKFEITVIPPAYSGLESQSQSGNQANVEGLKGSTISIHLTSNRPLKSSLIRLNEAVIEMMTSGKRAEGSFLLTADGEFTVHLRDKRGIPNRDPIPYRLQIIRDQKPQLDVLVPEPEIELGDQQIIPMHLKIEDDFGFSNLQIGYEVHRPSFIESEPTISMFRIPDLKPDQLSQEIRTAWDVSNLNLMPEDEVRYHFELYDNDDVSGPKQALSGTFVARVPSLADLFESVAETEETSMEEAELSREELNSIREQLEQTELELLKSDAVEWEQQQNIKHSMEAIREEIERLKSVAETLSELSKLDEKHNLFSGELQEKYQQLQELVRELINEEFLASMEDIQNALDTMDMDELRDSMKSLAQNVDQIEQELDRFIEIFERVQAEQKMDEVRRRLEQLLEQQETTQQHIEESSEQTSDSQWARMEEDEQRIAEEFDQIRDTMEEAAEAMEPFSPQASDALDQLESSELANQTEENLRSTQQNLRQQSPTASRQTGQAASNNLNEMLQESLAIQQQFQQQTSGEMAQKFQAVMRDVLTLSKAQEGLQRTTDNTPRNSSRLRELATRQQMLKDQLTQIMSALMDLSKQTFAVTPKLGQSIGRANAHMNSAKAALSERNSHTAQQEQSAAMEALNETAIILYQTMQNMQSGGSASGYEQFLESMQQMAGQQRKLNEQGMAMMLGQMNASAAQQMMQQLLQGQQGLKKSLDQLMKEMQQSGQQQGPGELGGIAEDMDEVIKDLQARRYTRKTVERKQRILSRMLDAQKSLTQRGEKEQRKSRTAESVAYRPGPAGLPDDLGQRRNLIMEAMNQALDAGYTHDYQVMIRRYFNRLSQEKSRLNPELELDPNDEETSNSSTPNIESLPSNE